MEKKGCGGKEECPADDGGAVLALVLIIGAAVALMGLALKMCIRDRKLEDLYDQSRGEPYLRTSLEDLKADGVEYRICPHSGKVTAAKIKEGQ